MSDRSGVIGSAKGFKVGDVLEGDEGYGPTRIRLTAIGRDHVLAVRIGHRSKTDRRYDHDGYDFEESWTLEVRDWRRIDPTAPWPEMWPGTQQKP